MVLRQENSCAQTSFLVRVAAHRRVDRQILATPEAVSQLAARLGSGELRSHEDVITGPVGDFPEVFLRRFRGENTGKLILALGNGGCRNLAASVKQPDMPARKENL